MADELSNQPVPIDPELIHKLRSGDREAGRLLDKTYRVAMQRFCLGYLSKLDQAEDAIQGIFFKVLSAKEVPDNFRAWLYRIARNHCLNLLRTRKRSKTTEDPLPSDRFDDQTGQLTRLIRIEQREHLSELLMMLSPAQQEVLRLRYTEGLSRSEVGDVLGIPETTVKSRLFEGLKILREHSSLLTDRP